MKKMFNGIRRDENLWMWSKVANLEPTITGRGSTVDGFQIVGFAQNTIV